MIINEPFEFQFSQETFLDPDGDEIFYNIYVKSVNDKIKSFEWL
jgi:hypothetical protein